MSTLYIINGRVGSDRSIGSYITSRNSVVDYTIRSPSILSKCVNFEVLDFDPLFSDIHCALQFSLKSNNTETCTISEFDVPINVDEPTIHNDKLGYIWDYTKKVDFIQNINTENIENIMTKLSLGNIGIDIIVNDINKIWQNSAAYALREKSPNLQRHEGDGGNSKWFNRDCRVSRINYLRNKDAFRRNKSYINKTNLIRSSREYTKCMSKAKQQSRKKFEQKLRKLKTTNPKSYWKLLNSNKNKAKKIPASINDLYKHFKSLNEHNNTINDNVPNDNSIHFQPELDYDFTDEVIRHIAKNLKKN